MNNKFGRSKLALILDLTLFPVYFVWRAAQFGFCQTVTDSKEFFKAVPGIWKETPWWPKK